ncbi:MAG: UbiA family prenyltransferase [Actinobacteria bacterium]|nr:UbiA family prenyltransferase [Actinomycetota bacterium]
MKVIGLLKASHFGPTMLVVTITCILSLTQFSIRDSIFIAFAILLGQFVVGWSNDLIDFPKDKAAGRIKKPLVAGTITEEALRISLGIALPSALIVSLMSPLGVSGTAIHFIGLLSATAYNFKLKSTLLSVVPYIVSFGALPWAIYVAAGNTPPTWIVLGFILFASAFHFLNVIKDLESDIDQKVMGLPQVLGRKKSIAMAALLGALGIVNVALANVRI